MTNDPTSNPPAERDGTSQLARAARAPRPDVSVDDRSIADLVAFAKEYGKQLRYFGLDDEAAGTWSAFVPEGASPLDIADFANRPERFPAADFPELHRPHFTLFMTFLKMVERCQAELNGFTRRHLDHYYRDVMRMSLRPPVADSVNVVIEPSRLTTQVLLPAGTPLTAGPDSLGRERRYTTDRDLVVSQAQIERLSTVHVEREITDLAGVRQEYRNDRERAVLSMLRLALGENSTGHKAPGEPLPAYPGSEIEPTTEFLDELKDLVAFAETDLRLKPFELRDLMRLRRRSDANDWDDINRSLTSLASSNRVVMEIDDPRDFDTNLQNALRGPPDFSTVSEVSTIYDLYDFRTRDDARVAIGELGFPTFDDFVAMMQIKIRLDGEWRAINRIIETAGRRFRSDTSYEIGRQRPDFEKRYFERNLRDAVGDPTYPDRAGGTLDSYYDSLLQLEAYFSMTAEEFLYVMRTTEGTGTWSQADEILTSAHRRAIHAERQRVLHDIRILDGVDAMLRHVLGDKPSATVDPLLLTRVEQFLGNPRDIEIITAARTGAANVAWDQVEAAAEVAQRNREGLAEPTPERRTWIGLTAARDALTAAAPVGTAANVDRWPTFGTASQLGDAIDEATPTIGWAVCSPLLALAEGHRIVDLTLALDAAPASPAELADALSFEVSTEQGWVGVDVTVAPRAAGSGTFEDLVDVAAITFRLNFDEKFDPITPLPADARDLESELPILRITLRPPSDGRSMRYPAVRRLRVIGVHLRVHVTGLASLQMRNDEAVVDPSGPFEPFTRTPAVGSRLLIGHAELATKQLDSLTFRYRWMGVPSNLQADYYKSYPIGENPRFTTDVIVVDRRAESTLGHAIAIVSSTDDQRIDLGTVEQDPLPGAATSGGVTSWDRYVAWELRAPDFQHGTHTRVATQKSIEMAAAISKNQTIVAANYLVNPPYTPKMRDFVVDYESSVELRLDRPRSGPDELFHVHPFGFASITRAGTPGGVPLVPKYDHEGELYIGLRGVQPPQTVSLLFQMAEGTASPDVEPPHVQWSYASGSEWRTLDDGSVLTDTTRGMITSGIVELALGGAEPTSLFDGDLYWLRATVAEHSAGVADTVAIHTQATTATFTDDDNAADHYASPLPADSITKTVDPIAGIAAVTQPYTSSGGRPAEEDDRFATRVSERLRHKQRALTMWDYEHLTLEQFPEIFKAKCIPAGAISGSGRPGTVRVVVIPDIRNRLPFNSFEPKAAPELLAEIHEFLAARAPDTAVLDVHNAHFRSVKVGFGVRFIGDGNDEFYKDRLTTELDRYLSPWAYDEGADIVIGSKIYATSIVDFLDRRPYVDFVADVRLFFSDDGDNYTLAPSSEHDGDHVAAGRPDAVLRAASEHEILVIGDDGFRTEHVTGIGFMKIELDLIVG